MTGAPDGGAAAALEVRLAGAVLWGVELEPRYRVLSATVELAGAGGTDPDGDRDARVLLVAHPVSTILAALRERTPEGSVLRRFTVEQLPDVAAALGGAHLEAPVLGRPEPRRGAWGPSFGLEGRSGAPDGTRRTVTLAAAQDDLRLDLFVRCDVVELRSAGGRVLASSESHGPPHGA